MGRAVILVALLLVPVTAAQPDFNFIGDILGQHLEDGADTVLPPLEELVKQDLHSEEIHVGVNLDIINVDYQLLGILFGGGKVQVDVDARLSIDFHAIGLWRVDEALQAVSGDYNLSARSTFGIPTHRLALTAEELRVIGAGLLLEAFEEQQAAAAQALLEGLVPGMVVLDRQFEWSNTAPGASVLHSLPDLPPRAPGDPVRPGDTPGMVPDLREPPLHLDARLRLQYLDRYSIADVLGDKIDKTPSSAKTGVKGTAEQNVRRNETLGVLDRNAFSVVGFEQFLDLSVPAGWRVEVKLRVPDGFTIESATNELRVDAEHQEAAYFLDGTGREVAANDGGFVTLSSRFLVTVTLLGVVSLAGIIARVPVELLIIEANHRHYERRKGTRMERRAWLLRKVRGLFARQ